MGLIGDEALGVHGQSKHGGLCHHHLSYLTYVWRLLRCGLCDRALGPELHRQKGRSDVSGLEACEVVSRVLRSY